MMIAKQIRIASQSVVEAIAFTDKSQVIGGYHNGDTRRWKIEDGQQLGQTMRAGGTIRSIAVSQDGRWIVSGDDGKKAIVWNAVTHEKVLHTQHKNWVTAVDISNDCTKVVSASCTATSDNVRIISIPSGTQLLPPISHSGIRGVKFSPDGSRFATASYKTGVRIYNTHDGKVLFDSGTRGSTKSYVVTPLAWSSDGQQLFVASKGKITCFDVFESSYSEWSIHDTRSDVSIASNGRFIACSAGTSVSLWDCASHQQIGNIITHTAEIICVALSPNGGYLACGLLPGKITIHNLRDVLPSRHFGSGPLLAQLPLVRVSIKTLESWSQGDPTNTETLLSEEITNTSCPSHYLLANRALIRARLKHVAFAMEDAEKSLRVRPSPIGYIAMAVALLGQADRGGALRIFDLAFHDCELDKHQDYFITEVDSRV